MKFPILFNSRRNCIPLVDGFTLIPARKANMLHVCLSPSIDFELTSPVCKQAQHDATPLCGNFNPSRFSPLVRDSRNFLEINVLRTAEFETGRTRTDAIAPLKPLEFYEHWISCSAAKKRNVTFSIHRTLLCTPDRNNINAIPTISANKKWQT